MLARKSAQIPEEDLLKQPALLEEPEREPAQIPELQQQAALLESEWEAAQIPE